MVQNLAKLNVMTAGFSVADTVQIQLAGNYGDAETASQISQSLQGLLPWAQLFANTRGHGHKHAHGWKGGKKHAKDHAESDAKPAPKRAPFVSSFSQSQQGETTSLHITLTKTENQ